MISSIKVYWLSYAVVKMICSNTGRARLVNGDHMQISFKSSPGEPVRKLKLESVDFA